MVPVELRLTNFLSYGTAAPPLDFNQFHVACLSGRNGQGKSALLDAITWALWGEARKSSGNRKPDEELIRIGARRMQVELVFDIEGERYRVMRSYARSATGKTSRSELELHVYEDGAGDYRPLTGAALRETQEHIDNLLGIDYDTFINSAFLLQGRSDEFTKKNPSERKEILGRILNLSRFDALAELARGRERDALERVRQAEAEIDRLKEALAQEPAWKAERAQVEAAVREVQQRLEALRQQERCLTERLASLEAQAREREAAVQTLAGLRERMAQDEEELQALEQRIAEADGLIAQKEQIERDYDRFEALQRERDELDTRSALHRGVEKQVEQREAELRDRKNEQEKRLHSLEVELKTNRSAHGECLAQLAEEPALRRKLEQARAAQQRFEAMNAVRLQREALENEIAGLERELLGQREALGGQRQALLEQIRQEAERLPALHRLEAEQQRLRACSARLQALQAQLEETRVKGQHVAETLREHSGRLAARRQVLQEQEDSFNRFHAATDGVCPTCGTHLTPAHREEVEAHYHTALQELRQEVGQIEAAMQKWKGERERLLQSYRALQQEADPFKEVPEQLATLDEQVRRCREAREQLEAQRLQAEALERRIEEKQYGEPQRQRWRTLKEQLEQMPFDAAAFDRLRDEAAQVDRYAEQLRSLEQVAGRRDQLAQAVRQGEAQVEQLRHQLGDGSLFGPLQAQIEQLRRQLATIAFEPHRLEAVKQALAGLGHAGARLKDLVHAQQSRLEWQDQGTRIRQRLARAGAEQEALGVKLAALEAALQERPQVEAEQRRTTTACQEQEAQLQQLQLQLGELTARLLQAAQDRAALKQCREEHAEAKAARTLYKHLRTAFGKHGIPSLIIEQTLPEIEERTNDLLERLSDGKMHVRLETLKDKKTGGTRETLEIIITDEQGVPRAYETFSGGEAFRVNFALRIALAQLLAERSGVRIRTLVVDEGFGTQDAQGVQNMVEAIQAIRQDFDKIIVITHLDELKEAFPIRIEVEKDPLDGSMFEMLGV